MVKKQIYIDNHMLLVLLNRDDAVVIVIKLFSEFVHRYFHKRLPFNNLYLMRYKHT